MKTEKNLQPAQKTVYLKSLSALEMGNYTLVVSLLQPLVLNEPEFFAGRKLLREAQVLRSRGKSSGLFGISTGGLSLGKSKIKKLIEAGDLDEALKEAEKEVDGNPTGQGENRDLHEAAEALAAKEREIVAPFKAEFEAAEDGDPKREAAKKYQAVSGKLEAYEEIAKFALATMTLDPKNTKARYELGEYLLRIEDFEGATKAFEEILSKNPQDLDARGRAKEAAARRSMQRGRLDKSSFSEMVKQRQVAAEKAGEKVASVEETAEEIALKVYEAHEAGTPDREAARKLADIYFYRAEFDKALEYYRYLSSLANDTDPGLLRKIADVENKKIVHAISEKEDAIEALASDDPTLQGLREELDELKRSRAENMLGEARKRVERNPTDLQYRFELGEQLVLAGHYKEAIPELQKARSNPNTRLRALSLLGKCYSERGMLDLAAKTLTDAAAEIPGMDGTKKDVVYSLGLVYERMGDAEKSLACMKEIYEVDYGFLDVAERVESSYSS